MQAKHPHCLWYLPTSSHIRRWFFFIKRSFGTPFIQRPERGFPPVLRGRCPLVEQRQPVDSVAAVRTVFAAVVLCLAWISLQNESHWVSFGLCWGANRLMDGWISAFLCQFTDIRIVVYFVFRRWQCKNCNLVQRLCAETKN